MFNAKLAPLVAQSDTAEASPDSETWGTGNEPKVSYFMIGNLLLLILRLVFCPALSVYLCISPVGRVGRVGVELTRVTRGCGASGVVRGFRVHETFPLVCPNI